MAKKINKTTLLVVDSMSNERGVSKEMIFEAGTGLCGEYFKSLARELIGVGQVIELV